MGESECGEVFVLLGKGCQAGDDGCEFGEENIESFSKEDEVGVAACQLGRPY
jgi:hypothetical protein